MEFVITGICMRFITKIFMSRMVIYLTHLVIEFVNKAQLLRCCLKMKSSYTNVYCGLNFSHALYLTFIDKLHIIRNFIKLLSFNFKM